MTSGRIVDDLRVDCQRLLESPPENATAERFWESPELTKFIVEQVLIAGSAKFLSGGKCQECQVLRFLGRGRCRKASCQRRIFTERLSKGFAPYAQQTKRTGEIIAAAGYALGRRPSQTLDDEVAMPVSVLR
jgi:hypothetical protein